jgi:hypothetical protein
MISSWGLKLDSFEVLRLSWYDDQAAYRWGCVLDESDLLDLSGHAIQTNNSSQHIARVDVLRKNMNYGTRRQSSLKEDSLRIQFEYLVSLLKYLFPSLDSMNPFL